MDNNSNKGAAEDYILPEGENFVPESNNEANLKYIYIKKWLLFLLPLQVDSFTQKQT